MRFTILAALLAMGCNNGDTGVPNGDDLPEVLEGITADPDCDSKTLPGDDDCFLSAASTYFAGDYDYNGDDVLGWEYWYWIPNPVLVENSNDWEPGQTCVMIWEIFGTKENNPDECNACEYRLSGNGVFRESESNCPADLEQVEGQDFPFSYDVRNTGSDVSLYFSASGTFLAEGTDSAGGLEWVSEADCALVGSAECPAR